MDTNASRRRVGYTTRCLIENTDKANIIHYAHCLTRETKDSILDALEFSWGISRYTLNLDTHYNVFHLGSKFHALYNKNPPTWLLLPEEHIIQQYYNARNDRHKFPNINEPSYKYNFLAHDDMASVPIHHLTPPDNLTTAPPVTAYTYIAHPYVTFGPVISHVHPQFVVCNAGKELEKMGFVRSLAFSRLHSNHVPALEMVGKIWEAWTNVADDPDFIDFCEKPHTPPTGDSMSSTSKRTALRRLFLSDKRHGSGHNETTQEGRGANEAIWLDDETLREHDQQSFVKSIMAT